MRHLYPRLTALLVVLSLLLAACGSSQPAQRPAGDGTTPTAAVAVEPTAAPTQVAANAEPTEATVSQEQPGEAQPTPTQAPELPTPTAEPTKPRVQRESPPTKTPPTPTPAPALPVRLKIDTPQVKVDAAIEYVGKVTSGPSAGAMDVPKKWEDVAWYKPGYVPGEPGNAVLAGHLDSTTGPAVFWRLNDLQIGDTVSLVNKDNNTLRFKVRKKEIYFNDNAPLIDIFGPAKTPRLNLITCDGVFDRSKKEYDRKLVVFTELVS
ncbi:MAG: sortase [Chloroflexota bacterium]|nr:sortase [Chloroflexota bacterium]